MGDKNHWERVYTEKAIDSVSWFQTYPTMSMKLIQATGVSKEEAIIDVGGGASVLVDSLVDEGYGQVAVLDIAGAALAHAKQRLGEKAASVEWYEHDVTTFVPPHPFRLWHDRAVFHFLTDTVARARYLEVLAKAVPVGGHVIIATFAIEGPEKCSGLVVERYDEAKIVPLFAPRFTLVEKVAELHRTPALKDQQFNFFRFRRELA
ncbi:MAG TPA: class I SAM-dependent methyltransferase [Gammaproteobacteria bacterium]